jgi:hypothetical protein
MANPASFTLFRYVVWIAVQESADSQPITDSCRIVSFSCHPQRRAGDIRQIDAQNGERIWKFDCGDLTGNDNCADAVEAEFR